MRAKHVISAIIFGILLSTQAAYAKEPVNNLSIVKQQLKRYHDSGQYKHDISAVIQESMRYLELRLLRNQFDGKKPALVLDIDDTSLSNYPYLVSLDFGGTREQIQANENKGNDEVIEPTLKLYRYAKEHHVAVIFITGRPEAERAATEANLRAAGYTDYDGLFFRTPEVAKIPAVAYKTNLRKQLVAQGYDIVLNIGDQLSDLRGGFADKSYKLPNPYYFIA